jgi:hypothetical protein
VIPVDAVPIAVPVVPPTPIVAPVMPKPPIAQPPPIVIPKAVKPKRIIDDIERQVTPQELQEANDFLKLGEDTAQKIRELREDILQGRVKATEPRKIELGFLPETKVQIEIPKKGIKLKDKYTKEQFEKYLETARRLDEQKKKRLAEAINDIINGAES